MKNHLTHHQAAMDKSTKIEVRPGRHLSVCVSANPKSSKTIFMLHGLGGRKEHWQAQYTALKDDYSIVAPDLYGHGNSDKPVPITTNPYSFSELNQDIQAVFDRYASNDNIVMGHSYGGALATSLTLAKQHAIQQLILLSPTPLAPDTGIPFLFKLPAPIMELARPLLEKNFRHLAFDPHTDPAIIENEILISRQNPMYVIKATVSGLLLTPHADITQLKTPSLLMLGKTDRLIPPEVSQSFYAALPNHHIVMIQDAAHMANIEKPEKVNEIVKKFLH